MKKLIAILVVFAMVAGATFAADISAEVFGNVNLAKGTTEKVNDESQDPRADGAGNGRIRLSASAESEDGKFGGWARLQAGSYGDTVSAWGIVWWKPLDVLKLQIGTNGNDGEFGLEGVTGWGFYAMPCEVIISNANVWGWGNYLGIPDDSMCFRNAFYGGFNEGTIVNLTPIEGLAINVGIPNFGDQEVNGKAEYVYKRSDVQIAYNAEGIGTFGFTYNGGAGFNEDDGIFEITKIFVYVGLNMIEGLGIDIGFGYPLKLEDVQEPMSIGLGVDYGADAFGVKLRGLAQLGANEYSQTWEEKTTGILVDILPYFNISDNLTFFFSAGLGMAMNSDWDENLMGWHVQPYIVVGNQWSAAFYAGFRIESPMKSAPSSDIDSITNWSIPLGITMSF